MFSDEYKIASAKQFYFFKEIGLLWITKRLFVSRKPYHQPYIIEACRLGIKNLVVYYSRFYYYGNLYSRCFYLQLDLR